MKQNNWGRISLFSGLFQIFFGAMLVMSMSGQKDSWNYYLSSSHRSNIDTGSMIGWLIILAGVVELIYGIIVMFAGEQAWSSNVYEDATAEDIEWIEGEIVKKEWDPTQHHLEWYTVKKKDGSTTKIWKHVSNPVVCKVGDCGRIRVADGQITEFGTSNQEN
ncbi:MAG: hypothetical protein E7451_09700 [Ruminococcaceae bacterium]|nr:hypothetical protein [Oscillospiraceae bacterium]